MKKFFTLALTAMLCAGAWAETAILSYNLGKDGALLTDETGKVRVIVGEEGSAAPGWKLAMAGDGTKKWDKSEKMTVNEIEYTALKNSNGTQDTICLPEGLYASQVDFYVVSNHESTKGVLQEFDGEAAKDTVHSLKDYAAPTHIVKTLELAKNSFTFKFGVKQVCFIAVVTYSNVEPEKPKPFGLLSWQLGENGAEATAANSITGAAGSLAEGWTIAITGATDKNWGAGGKMTIKGKEYKTLKNSNGAQNTLTLPKGLYATDIEFRAVTNDGAEVGSLKEFDGESVKDTVFSLKDYSNPTIITKEFKTPKNEFTFTFGGKQVCFLAIIHYTDEAPTDPEPEPEPEPEPTEDETSTGILSYQLGEDGAEITKDQEANSITGAKGSKAEGWTITMIGDPDKKWGGGDKIKYNGNEYKSLKNSNGVQILLSLPDGLYATQVDFYAVTKEDDGVGSLKEFNDESVKDTVYSHDYAAPTHITKNLATPKNKFTFNFGGKQVCFIAIVKYTDEEPKDPEPEPEPEEEEGLEGVQSDKVQSTKILRNGQLVIIRDGRTYNALGQPVDQWTSRP